MGWAAHQHLLRPCDAAAMRAYAISTRVNSPANNDAQLLEAA